MTVSLIKIFKTFIKNNKLYLNNKSAGHLPWILVFGGSPELTELHYLDKDLYFYELKDIPESINFKIVSNQYARYLCVDQDTLTNKERLKTLIFFLKKYRRIFAFKALWILMKLNSNVQPQISLADREAILATLQSFNTLPLYLNVFADPPIGPTSASTYQSHLFRVNLAKDSFENFNHEYDLYLNGLLQNIPAEDYQAYIYRDTYQNIFQLENIRPKLYEIALGITAPTLYHPQIQLAGIYLWFKNQGNNADLFRLIKAKPSQLPHTKKSNWLLILSLLGTAMLWIGWSLSYKNNLWEINTLHTIIKTDTEVNPDILLQQQSELKSPFYNRWFLHLGLWTGNYYADTFLNIDRVILQKNIISWLSTNLERIIQQNLAVHDEQALYQNFRIYMMLVNPDHLNPRLAELYLIDMANQEFKGDQTNIGLATTMIKYLMQNSFQPITSNLGLIKQAQNELLNNTTAEDRLYFALLQNLILIHGSDIQLNDQTVPYMSEIFNNTTTIPFIATPQAYQQIATMMQNLQHNDNDGWLLSMVDPLSNLPPDTEQNLLIRFSNNMNQTWLQALNDLTLQPTTDSVTLQNQLSLLASANSPWIKLMISYSQDTQLNELAKTNQFKWNFLNKKQNASPTVLYPIWSANLRQNLQNIQAAYSAYIVQPGPQNLKAVANALNNLNTNTALPQVILKWSTEFSTIITRIIVNQLQSKDLRQVQMLTDFYNNSLAAFYPFNLKSSQDVSPNDVIKFFGVGGMIDNIIPTLSNSSKNETLKKFIAQKNYIQNYWLSQNKLDFNCTILPINADNNILNTTLTINKTILFYQHDPQQPKFIRWNFSQQGYVNFTINDLNNETYEKEFYGPWALFKFLTSTCNMNVQKIWACNINKQTVDFKVFDSSGNPLDLQALTAQ